MRLRGSRVKIPSETPFFDRLLWRIVLAGVIAIPFTVTTAGFDWFRFPKELLLRLLGLAIIAVAISALLWKGSINLTRTEERWSLFVAAVVLWATITTITSTNPQLSPLSLLWVICAAALFLAVLFCGVRASVSAVLIPLIPAVANAVLYLLQEFEVWNPFRLAPEFAGHLSRTAFIGNPIDVASFLVPPTLASLAVAFVKPEFRLRLIPAIVLLSIAIFATRSLTGIVAFASGVMAMLLLRPRRDLIIGVGAITILVLFAVTIQPALKEEFVRAGKLAAQREYDRALSNRLTAFTSAWLMALDHPFVGVGPGCFGWNFMEYKRRAEHLYPELRGTGLPSFAEVHNDHLEVLAETGWPGYLLSLGAIVLLSSNSRRRLPIIGESAERKVGRLLSFPLALSLVVLALAGFPLQLAAPTVVYFYEAGLCCSWSG